MGNCMFTRQRRSCMLVQRWEGLKWCWCLCAIWVCNYRTNVYLSGRQLGCFISKPADMHKTNVTCMLWSKRRTWHGLFVYPKQCGKPCGAECLNGCCIFTWTLKAKQLNPLSHISQGGCAHCHQLCYAESQTPNWVTFYVYLKKNNKKTDFWEWADAVEEWGYLTYRLLKQQSFEKVPCPRDSLPLKRGFVFSVTALK